MPNHGAHRSALELTIAGDEVLADPVHSGLLQLARSLADQLDHQGDNPESRTLATYSGQLNAIRRVVRDARALRRKEQAAPTKTASRLALIQQQAKKGAA